MINFVPNDKCCGCEACVQACRSHCIKIIEDNEGFSFPKMDLAKCIKCNRCDEVCPVVNRTPKREPIAGYAYCSKDEELLKKTSSGGFFTAAAEMVLNDGGVVFGAAINERNEVVHAYVESINELDSLRRSKYVQSRIGDSFVDCLKFLNSDRKVLFCGTPCQVKALNLFVGKTRDNLITMDFVCHGVPSPGVFRKYLGELCEKYHEAPSDIKEINFREKFLGFAYGFSFVAKNKKYLENPEENLFLRGFLSDLYLRQSCHHCPAKNFTSGADYTMCDFWGIEKAMPNFPRNKLLGVSQVFVLNDKLNMFGSANKNAVVESFNLGNLWCRQKWLRKSVPMTIRRKKFFDNYAARCSVCESIAAFERPTCCEWIRARCVLLLASIARKVGIR